jgi:predicted HicB family RNase H-like nuclease
MDKNKGSINVKSIKASNSLKGNTNAKKENPKTAQLVIRLTAEKKILYQKAAKNENLSLTEWVIRKLDGTKN